MATIKNIFPSQALVSKKVQTIVCRGPRGRYKRAVCRGHYMRGVCRGHYTRGVCRGPRGCYTRGVCRGPHYMRGMCRPHSPRPQFGHRGSRYKIYHCNR